MVTYYANRLALKRPPLPLLRPLPDGGTYSSLIAAVDHWLTERHKQRKLILPNLAAFDNKGIGFFSDYSGESNGRYNVYSVLVTAMHTDGLFQQRVRAIREEVKLGTTEFAFKDLRMGQMLRALPGFLAAADSTPGFILTVAIDKQLRSVFGQMPDVSKQVVDALKKAGFPRRPAKIAEKLLRIVHLIAYLAALLGHNGQKLFWMTDNDDIAPTREDHLPLLHLLDGVLPHYLPVGRNFEIVTGALPFGKEDTSLKDLLSIPDLVAGTIADYMSKRSVLKPEDIFVKGGAAHILQWLAQDGLGMKKLCLLIQPGPNGTVEHGIIDIALVRPVDTVIIPIYD